MMMMMMMMMLKALTTQGRQGLPQRQSERPTEIHVNVVNPDQALAKADQRTRESCTCGTTFISKTDVRVANS